MKNTQKGFISIAVIVWIIVGALVVGGTTYVVVNQMSDNEGNAPKDRSSGQSAGIKTDDDNDGQPAEVNFDTSSTVQTETSISSDATYPSTSPLYTLRGLSMPFEISYINIWKIHGHGGPKEDRPIEIVELTTDERVNFTNASPIIRVISFKSGDSPSSATFPYQSATGYCEDANPEGGTAGLVREKLIINGYDTCRSYVSDGINAIRHSYILYHNGYFVFVNFEEKYTKGVTTSTGTVVTDYDNFKYLPEFKKIAYSVKFTN